MTSLKIGIIGADSIAMSHLQAQTAKNEPNIAQIRRDNI